MKIFAIIVGLREHGTISSFTISNFTIALSYCSQDRCVRHCESIPIDGNNRCIDHCIITGNRLIGKVDTPYECQYSAVQQQA